MDTEVSAPKGASRRPCSICGSSPFRRLVAASAAQDPSWSSSFDIARAGVYRSSAGNHQRCGQPPARIAICSVTHSPRDRCAVSQVVACGVKDVTTLPARKSRRSATIGTDYQTVKPILTKGLPSAPPLVVDARADFGVGMSAAAHGLESPATGFVPAVGETRGDGEFASRSPGVTSQG